MSAKIFLDEAEDAARSGNHELAIKCFWAAGKLEPTDVFIRMRLGVMLRKSGRMNEALEEFTTVTKLSPEWGEAWREKGVIEGIIARAIPAGKRPKWLNDGQASLERATRINPDDFDAWASLGGVLKNVQDNLPAALQAYWKSAEVSNWHPYPLLNALRLEATIKGHFNFSGRAEHLKAAESLRRGQCQADPPSDSPWCFFDLAEILLYQDNVDEFLSVTDQGIEKSTANWEVETFKNSLVQLQGLGMESPELSKGVGKLTQASKKMAATQE
ncbi:MAG: tetratricopeptide (TPR) repeat protein [Gammaproteobacteria bacterium]